MKNRKIRVCDIIPLIDQFEIVKAVANGTDITVKMAFPTLGVWADMADIQVVGIKKRSDCIELSCDLGIRSERRKKSIE